MSEIARLLEELKAREVRGSIRQFGNTRAGSILSNDKGDHIITMLDSAGYYTVTVNGRMLLSGQE